MNRERVVSSNIISIGYDPLARTLEVEFGDDPTHPGRVYRYFEVPSEIHRDLMAAASHGKFLHQNVMWVFSYKRLQ